MNKPAVCVYCGSSSGVDPAFTVMAKQLGAYLAAEKITLVYGGAAVGLMGALANEVIAGGGEVIGVMPKVIVEREVAHKHLSELIEVDDMHQRKAKMMALADAFVAMPGGVGTLEELFEALTWAQLGIHAKPCGLLNTNQFYQSLLDFLGHGVEQGFVHKSVLDGLLVGQTPEQLIPKLLSNQ